MKNSKEKREIDDVAELRDIICSGSRDALLYKILQLCVDDKNSALLDYARDHYIEHEPLDAVNGKIECKRFLYKIATIDDDDPGYRITVASRETRLPIMLLFAMGLSSARRLESRMKVFEDITASSNAIIEATRLIDNIDCMGSAHPETVLVIESRINYALAESARARGRSPVTRIASWVLGEAMRLRKIKRYPHEVFESGRDEYDSMKTTLMNAISQYHRVNSWLICADAGVKTSAHGNTDFELEARKNSLEEQEIRFKWMCEDWIRPGYCAKTIEEWSRL